MSQIHFLPHDIVLSFPYRSVQPNSYLVLAVFCRMWVFLNSAVYRGIVCLPKRGYFIRARTGCDDETGRDSSVPEGPFCFCPLRRSLSGVTIWTYLTINLFGREVCPSMTHRSTPRLGKRLTRTLKLASGREIKHPDVFGPLCSNQGARRPFFQATHSILSARKKDWHLTWIEMHIWSWCCSVGWGVTLTIEPSHHLAMSESAQKGHRLTALLSQCNSHIPAAEQWKCQIVPHANRMERGRESLWIGLSLPADGK